MANISITIPDAVVPRVLDAFDGSYPGRPQGVTQAAWAKRQVINYVRDVTVSYERQQAAIAAAAAAEAAANQDVDIT